MVVLRFWESATAMAVETIQNLCRRCEPRGENKNVKTQNVNIRQISVIVFDCGKGGKKHMPHRDTLLPTTRGIRPNLPANHAFFGDPVRRARPPPP